MNGARPAIVARHVFVRGRVQGVAFRWSTVQAAARWGVVGWVRNLTDGRVEVHVQGAPADVEGLLTWLGQGPPAARVDQLDVEPTAAIDVDGFEQRGTAAS